MNRVCAVLLVFAFLGSVCFGSDAEGSKVDEFLIESADEWDDRKVLLREKLWAM